MLLFNIKTTQLQQADWNPIAKIILVGLLGIILTYLNPGNHCRAQVCGSKTISISPILEKRLNPEVIPLENSSDLSGTIEARFLNEDQLFLSWNLSNLTPINEDILLASILLKETCNFGQLLIVLKAISGGDFIVVIEVI